MAEVLNLKIFFSGIEGWTVDVLQPVDPTKASQLMLVESVKHLILTAETHNFPTGVCPFRYLK